MNYIILDLTKMSLDQLRKAQAWQRAIASTRLEGIEIPSHFMHLVRKNIQGEITSQQMIDMLIEKHNRTTGDNFQSSSEKIRAKWGFK
jgi:hypothetical protein